MIRLHFAAPSVLLACGFSLAVAGEDSFQRRGQPEIFGSGFWATGQSTVMEGDGFTFDVDFGDAWGGGIGGGYNLDDHWNFNVNGNMGTIETEVATLGSTVSSSALAYSVVAGVDYNVLPSRLSPLVCANLGFAWFDDDVYVPTDSGGISGVSLSYLQPTFQAGGGAGFRWDFSDHLFLKAVYRVMWNTGLDAMQDDMVFHSVTIMAGYKF